MSDIDSSKTDNSSNLIDFDSSISDHSSGELYEPSEEFGSDDSRYHNISQSESILNRVGNSLSTTDSILKEAGYLLRSTSNFKRETEKIEMSQKEQTSRFMTVHQALNLIPIFNGENSDDSFAFHNACEYALQSIDPIEKENFVRGITTRLIGKAVRPFRHRIPKTYEELKAALGNTINKKQTLAHLHSKVATFRIVYGETIQQYSDRAEQLYYDIIEASIATEEISNTEDLSKITEKQILSAYIEGLPHDTKILVKASRPKTLTECVQVAQEEETSRLNQKEIRRNINECKTNRPDIKSHYGNQGHRTSLTQKSNFRPPPGACFRCGRTNHQAKQCRATETDIARYRDSQNRNKMEPKGIKVVTCSYCKKPYHTINECRKRKYVNERKAQGQQGTYSGIAKTIEGNKNSHFKPARTLYFKAELINNHVMLNISQCTMKNVKLLLDTGSDLNMIKLSALKNETMVDETHCYQIKGINEHLVHTIGLVHLDVDIDNKTVTVPFQVIQDNFPIPHEGILGKPFLIQNNITIDYKSSKIHQSNTDQFKLAPRTETVIPIASAEPEGTALLIHSQTLEDKSVRLGNIVNFVKKGQIMAIAINVSEHPVTLPMLNVKDLQFEEFNEVTILVATNTAMEHNYNSRMNRIRETIKIQGLNTEELNSLWKVISEYMDIFHLEGDSFPTTDAVHHEIRLKSDVPPVNIRPYRLSYTHRQEIVKQMEELERNHIIQPSDSPWNVPLIVVPKKPDSQSNLKYRVCVDFRRLNQLMIGKAFPIKIIPESLPDLFKISEIAIFIKDNYLIFSLQIPLLSGSEYNMYHPIPFPITFNEEHLLLIDPEISYLALSVDDQKFFSLSSEQWAACTKLKLITICKVEQPIYSRAGSNICEISLLTGQQTPNSCKVKLISPNTPIWKRIGDTNAWIFYTKSESITITCPKSSRTSRFDISGVGRLSTSTECEIHTPTSVLLPIFGKGRNIFNDLVPEDPEGSTKLILSRNIPILPGNNFWIVGLENHVVIIYVFLLTILSAIIVLVSKTKNRKIKMYDPEVASRHDESNV